MTALLAQVPTLQLFAPLLVAAAIALGVLILGRVVATRKFNRALAENATWAPPIEAPPHHPLNEIRRRRVTLNDLIEPVRAAADSGEITSPFCRA